MSEEVKQEPTTNVNTFEVESNVKVEETPKVEEKREEKNSHNDNDLEEVGTENPPKRKNRAKERIEKLSREKRELAKELEALKNEKNEKSLDSDLDPDNFENYDDYLEALTKTKDEKPKEEKKPVNAKDDDFQQTLDEIEVKFDDTRDKYEDFDEIVQKSPDDGGPTITQSMVEAMNNVEHSGEVVYALAKDVNESIRISKLNPVKQVIAIAKLNDKFSGKQEEVKKPTKKVTEAPEPINALGGGETIQPSVANAKSYSEFESIRKQDNRSNNGWQ